MGWPLAEEWSLLLPSVPKPPAPQSWDGSGGLLSSVQFQTWLNNPSSAVHFLLPPWGSGPLESAVAVSLNSRMDSGRLLPSSYLGLLYFLFSKFSTVSTWLSNRTNEETQNQVKEITVMPCPLSSGTSNLYKVLTREQAGLG